jgi:RIO-like serine/threonine protein kinase
MEARIKAAKNLSNRVRLNKKNWPIPMSYMGGGVYGRIFTTNNGRLMKIQKMNSTKEFNILKRLRSTGMVPKVKNGNIVKLKLKSGNKNITRELGYGSKNINSLNMFIMNRVGTMTLKQYYKLNPPTQNYDKFIQNYIRWLVRRLQMAGIEHGNLHRENIIVSVDSKGQISGMWLIDFGKSKYHNAVPNRNLISYMKLYRHNYTPVSSVRRKASPKKTRPVSLRMTRSVQ